jgi:hypothetical protein
VRAFAAKGIPGQTEPRRGKPTPQTYRVNEPLDRPASRWEFSFSRAAIFPPPPPQGTIFLQPKLTIGTVNDPLEQEAESAADAILRMAEPATIAPPSSPGGAVSLQRQCACGGTCSGCKEEADRLRMKSLGPRTPAGVAAAPPVVHEALRSSGQPLDTGTRTFMEPRLGHDFGDVRVHTDDASARSAAAIRAQAYTVGRDIVFAAGQFAPQSSGGRRLLAHELTHVVQQRHAAGTVVQRAYACGDLLPENPAEAATGVILGQVAHAMIQEDFTATVPTARSVYIPGAYANPLRTSGLCGADKSVTAPQVIGSGPSPQSKAKGGVGEPDLASADEKELFVAEIKPAVLPCLVDGEKQLAGYVLHGNARDEAAKQWRAQEGVRVVLPMPADHFHPPRFSLVTALGDIELLTGWCQPGLLGYAVRVRGGKPWVVGDRMKVGQDSRVRADVRATQPEFDRYVGQLPQVEAAAGRDYVLAIEAGLYGQIVAELGRQQVEQTTRAMRVDPRDAPFIAVEPALLGAAVVVAPFEIAAVGAMLAMALPVLMAAVATAVEALGAAAALAIESLVTAIGRSVAVATVTRATATALALTLTRSGIAAADATKAVEPLVGKRATALVDVSDPWADEPSPAADHEEVNVGGATFRPIIRLTTGRAKK